MKSIRQWLETLPEPYRGQALANLENPRWEMPGYHHDPEKIVASIMQALTNAFRWSYAPEGAIYWRALSDKLLEAQNEKERMNLPLE